MNEMIKIDSLKDIPEKYQFTPISLLLEYHNLNRSYDTFSQAELLVGMCMDNRKKLRIPENFAFIIRSGGGNLRYSEFKVSFAVAVGGVSYIALIGHNHCGMVNLYSKKDKFINGLVDNAGWTKEAAEEHFINYAPIFEIDNEVGFVLSEAKRLRLRYPKIIIVPMMYLVEDNMLYLINEDL
jgi:carbonic anhydrase